MAFSQSRKVLASCACLYRLWSVCDGVCVREKERESVCMCVNESVCVCVCERERERESV